MQIVSIDIETSGLNPEEHDVMEFAAVLWDSSGDLAPVVELPFIDFMVEQPFIIGEVEALAMNSRILKILAGHIESEEYVLIQRDAVALAFVNFLKDHGFGRDTDWEGRIRFNAAGKNVSAFDLQFLKRLPGWNCNVVARARVLDPAILFVEPNDEYLPSMEECLRRAHIDPARYTHHAIDDARLTIELLQARWKR